MKLFLMLAVLGFTTSGFAQTCRAYLEDQTNRLCPTQVGRTYTGFGLDCMKECNKYHTLTLGDNPRYKCERERTPCTTNRPQPLPPTYGQPLPPTYPQPYPQVSEAQRPLRAGETVYVNSGRYTVIGQDYYGNGYSLRSIDSYYSTISRRRDEIAITSGCDYNYYNQQICVGNTVQMYDSYGYTTYYSVVALHFNGNVTLRSSDSWSSQTRTNVPTSNLQVVR